MEHNLLFLISFLLVSISMVAQDVSDKKCSLEASYPLSNNDEYSSDGIIDFGLKYRFKSC